MARRISQADPSLEISFFNSGFWTYRSQLFAPFKPIGVTVVSYREPVLDGANLEDTDLLEWQRRPGFSIFCPTPLGDAEIVNQFYSYRDLNGIVHPLFDSSLRLAQFSSSGLTNIVSKSTPNQGYVTNVGNMLYFSDGVAADYYKYDGTNLSVFGLAAPTVMPVASGLGFWQQYTSFGFGQSLLDTNGNIESLSSVTVPNGTTANPSFFSSLPLLGAGSGPWSFPGTGPFAGDGINSAGPGYTEYLFLGSFNLNIPTGAVPVGIQFTLYRESVSGSGRNWVIIDQSVRLVIGGAVIGTDHASASQWSNNTLTPENYGSPTDTWGVSPTPTQLNANGASGFGIAIAANAFSGSGSPNGLAIGTNGAAVKAVVTIYYQPSSIVAPSAPGLSGKYEPIWPLTIGTTVQDGSVVWTNYGPILTWYPVTFYPTPVVILDPNGNLQLGSSASNTTNEWNSSTNYTTGQIVTYGGLYWISVYGGTNVGVPPATNYTTSTLAGSVTTNQPYWAQTPNPIATGNIAPVWNTAIGGITGDGDYTWENIGQGTGLAFTTYEYVYGFRTVYGHLTTSSPFSNPTGPILGPLNGAISSFSINSNIITFVGNNNFIVGNMFQVSGLSTPVGETLNEQVFKVTAALSSSSFPLTSVAVSGSNVLTILAINRLVVGQQVTFTGVGTATFLNGQTVTVLASGLSGTQFEANFTHGSYGPTTDFGTVNALGTYSANYTHTNVSSTTDSGEAFPLIATIMGVGTASPLCNSVATITQISLTGDIATITANNNFQPGIWVTITGLTTANGLLLNGQPFQVIAVDQPVGTQNTFFQVVFTSPNFPVTADSGTATFNAVEIYRTSDGGGNYLFAGAVTNPGANLNWIYNDFVPDANLDVVSIAPLSHQNDPPPGAPGSLITTAVGTITAYWQGRLWIAAGNYVYFDAGPDCTNGIPEESWPPAYRFQFSGPVLGLIPTPDGVGLLVYLADRVNAILGGPETISFYPTDFLTNFGISNPNALFRDGSVIGQFTTQTQYIELLGGNKENIGQHIGDYLAANFSAVKAYVTMHRDGLDVGTFISNGIDRVLRFGNNIEAWSVPAFPAAGAGALRSIETSVGVYSLMLATPAGGKTQAQGPLNPTAGINFGAGTAWATPSNITAGNPTSYATVTLNSAGSSQALRATYAPTLDIPNSAIVQGVQVKLIGLQSETAGDIHITIKPSNAVAGATSHTFSLGLTNTTENFGSTTDLWDMPWGAPFNANALGFDITATLTAGGTGGSRVFDGNNYITTPHFTGYDSLTTGTYAFWVYPTAADNNIIFEKDPGTGPSLKLTGGVITATLGDGGTGAISSTTVPLNAWTHVAMTYNYANAVVSYGASNVTFDSVAVSGSTAVYHYTAFTGLTPAVGMIYSITGFVASGGANNITTVINTGYGPGGLVTAVDLVAQKITITHAGCVNETHAGSGALGSFVNTGISNPASNSSSPWQNTYPSASLQIYAGNILLAWAGTDTSGSAGATISDTAGNVWNVLEHRTGGTIFTRPCTIWLWYAVVATTTTTVVTVTSAGNTGFVNVTQWQGPLALDQHSSKFTATGNADPQDAPSVTTVSLHELVIGCFFLEESFGVSSPWIATSPDGNLGITVAGYQPNLSPGTYTPAGIVGGSSTGFGAATVAFIQQVGPAAGDIQLYINGTEVSYSQYNINGSLTPANDSAAGFSLGNDGTYGDNNGLVGNIAEFAVWNTALTGTQVATLAASTSGAAGVATANIQGYWHLCGLVSPEPDASGNGNVGTLYATDPPTTGVSSPGYTGCGVAPREISISEVQITVTYQNAGNYLYARDLQSWGDGGVYGQNNGQPYTSCYITIGNITLSPLGGRLFPLQHIVGYFDAVGNLGGIGDAITGASVPSVWILPNEVAPTMAVPFVYLPEVIQEPPIGQNHPSTSIQALRWNVNMANSQIMSQFMHTVQVKIEFQPELAPNTIKALAFSEFQDT